MVNQVLIEAFNIRPHHVKAFINLVKPYIHFPLVCTRLKKENQQHYEKNQNTRERLNPTLHLIHD